MLNLNYNSRSGRQFWMNVRNVFPSHTVWRDLAWEFELVRSSLAFQTEIPAISNAICNLQNARATSSFPVRNSVASLKQIAAGVATPMCYRCQVPSTFSRTFLPLDCASRYFWDILSGRPPIYSNFYIIII